MPKSRRWSLLKYTKESISTAALLWETCWLCCEDWNICISWAHYTVISVLLTEQDKKEQMGKYCDIDMYLIMLILGMQFSAQNIIVKCSKIIWRHGGFFEGKVIGIWYGDLGPCCHERGYYVATVQYHPLDFSDRPLNYLSFSSDHLIYLGLLQWIYCLVFFQNWNVKPGVMYAVALCCESSTDPPKAASSWSLDRARNK